VESFRETSDRLKALGVDLPEQAAALGRSYQAIRLMRLDPGSKGYRPPPERSNWSSAWAALLRERAKQLQAEADRLEREAGAAQ
jgi:hypothetical protein